MRSVTIPKSGAVDRGLTQAPKGRGSKGCFGEDRDHWQQSATEWERLAREADDRASQWQAVALKNKSVAEQNAAIAQQNASHAAQWQSAPQTPRVSYNPFTAHAERMAAKAASKPTTTSSGSRPPPPMPVSNVIELEKNGKWATDSVGNAYRIDTFGGRKTIDMTR